MFSETDCVTAGLLAITSEYECIVAFFLKWGVEVGDAIVITLDNFQPSGCSYSCSAGYVYNTQTANEQDATVLCKSDNYCVCKKLTLTL